LWSTEKSIGVTSISWHSVRYLGSCWHVIVIIIGEQFIVCFCSVIASVNAAVRLADVFSYDCGTAIGNEDVKAIAHDVGDHWMELAAELDMETDEIPSKRPGTLQCQKMLKDWCKECCDKAVVCVLCDALYACGLQHVADSHFGHIFDTVLRTQFSATDRGASMTALDCLINTVVTHGSNRWYGLGLALQLEPATIESITHTKSDDGDKLLTIIEKKRQDIGSEKLGEELLNACGRIHHPIRGIVEEALTVSSQ
jgi:hypothetical protein